MTKKDKIQLIITLGLGVVLIFVVIQAFQGKGRPKQKAASQAAGVTGLNGTGLPKLLVYDNLEKQAAEVKLERDPFEIVKVQSTLDGKPVLILMGISWDEQEPIAIINDTVLKKGSAIEGHTVVDIFKDKIILNDGNTNLELKLQL